MAYSNIPREEKKKVKERVEEFVGSTHQGAKGRTDWRVSSDGTLSVFMTFSKSEQLFYDANRDDLERWLEYPKSFVTFVMGHHTEVLIIPVPFLHEELTRKHKVAEGGNYKLHLVPQYGGYRFRELPNLDLIQFHNNYAQLVEDER